LKSQKDRVGFSRPSCDFVWARRARRSFRLFVAVSFLFTFMLWFAEGYLRYDQSEVQYRMSLTLHPAQARPILRTVVRRETELKKAPSPLYMEALALVEEPDKMLEAYARAQQANPRDMSLLLKYGCLLYFEKNYVEARERFREAGANLPANALTGYLEAAALAATLGPDSEINDLMALLRRSNASTDPVLFPEPLWHDSLPERGSRYNTLRMDIAARICEPLRQCADIIFSRLLVNISQKEAADWEEHLEKIQSMGVRLMGLKEGDSPPTMVQLQAALQIQQRALSLQTERAKITGSVLNPIITDTALQVDEVLEAIQKFEANRPAAESNQRSQLLQPIRLLLKTGGVFLALYVIAFFMHKAGSGGKRLRALPHTRMAVVPPLSGFGVLVLILGTLAVANHYGFIDRIDAFVPALWSLVVGMMLVIGILYPLLQIRTGFARGDLPAEIGETVDREQTPGIIGKRIPLLKRVGVYGCLLRRYMGILLGGFIIMVCLWLVVHRIALSAYPFQLELLNTGVEIETQNLIQDMEKQLERFVL